MRTSTTSGSSVELLLLLMNDAEQVRTHADDWISIQALALGAILLPVVGVPVVLPSLDLPEALKVAVGGTFPGVDRRETQARVRAAEAMFAAHLRASYLIEPEDRPGAWLTFESWLDHQALATIIAELLAAAWFNRLRLLALEFGGDGLLVYLTGSPGWRGAVQAARDHPFSVSGSLGSGQP